MSGPASAGASARERTAIPEWFSAEDLIAAPWETADSRFV